MVMDDRLRAVLNEVHDNRLLADVALALVLQDKTIVADLHSLDIVTLGDLSQKRALKYLDKLTTVDRKRIMRNVQGVFKNHELLTHLITELIQTYPTMQTFLFADVFAENQWRIVREHAAQFGIQTLGDLNHDNTMALLNSPGIGKTKILRLLTVLRYQSTIAPKAPLPTNEHTTPSLFWAYGLIKSRVYHGLVIEDQIGFVTAQEAQLLLQRLPINKPKRERLREKLETITEQLARGEVTFLLPPSADSYLDFTLRTVLTHLHQGYLIENEAEILGPYLDQEMADLMLQWANESDFPLIIQQMVAYYLTNLARLFAFATEIPTLLHSENEQVIFTERILKDENTLQEVGETLGITRERVRQIEKKVREISQTFLIVNGIDLVLEHLATVDLFVQAEDENDALLQFVEVVDGSEQLIYSDLFDFYTTDIYHDIVQSLEKLLLELPKTAPYMTILAFIEKVQHLATPHTQNFIEKWVINLPQFLDHVGLRLYDSQIIPQKMYKTDLLYYIMVKHFAKTGINITDEADLAKLREYFKDMADEETYREFFETDAESLNRKLTGLFERQAEKIVKIASHQYVVIQPETIPHKLLTRVADFIADELITEDVVYAKKIANVFADELAAANLTEFQIYYYLRLFYHDEFTFGHGNTMRIYAKDSEKLSTEAVVYNKLLRMGGKAQIAEVSEQLGIEPYTLSQLATTQSHFKISNGVIRIDSLTPEQLSPALLATIERLGEKALKKYGAIAAYKMYTKLQEEPQLAQELQTLNIHEVDEFMSLLKQLYPQLEGHTKYLTYPNAQISALDLLLQALPDRKKIHREQLLAAGESFGYSSSTIYLITYKYVQAGRLISLDENYFIEREQLVLDQTQQARLNDWLISQFVGRTYISVCQLDLTDMPDIGLAFPWTYELFNAITLHYLHYQKVNLRGATVLSDPLLIMLPTVSCVSYDALAKEVLQTYEGDWTEADVVRYLLDNGLIKANRSAREIIPKQLFVDEVLGKNEQTNQLYLVNE